jgi:heterogeneous nuclear ribonucleoprotein A1/A3
VSSTGSFAGNVTDTGSPNGNSYAGGFGGGETIGANKVQYNGQDDLLGADFFSESEDRHARRSA